MKPRVKVISRFRSTLAFSLMLWCAGAGCMIVSYAHGAAMTGAAVPEVSSGGAGLGTASASAGAHSCCKARHKSERRIDSPLPASPSESATKETELAEVPNQTDAMSCCPLTSGTFVTSNRQRAGNDESSAARGIDPISIVSNAPVAAARFPELRSPYQSQTHLRLCVFLI